MSSADDVLRRCWHDIAGPGFEHTGDLLVTRHSEPHRRYHTAEHVRWVLHHVTSIVDAEPGSAGAMDGAAIRAAALFHDVVYDPASTTNEADSADVAVHALVEVGWAEDRRRLVHDLVVATAGHVPDSPACAVLLDADLAILGSDPSDYSAYVAGVRFEYRFVDDTAWQNGRATVLRAFLDRDRIYTTAAMAQREPQARINLGAELAALMHA